MELDKEFIPYEQALALKELGFDEECFMSYNPNPNWWDKSITNLKISSLNGGDSIVCSAPLYQQAFRWFRENYNLDKTIDSWTEQPVGNEIWDKAYQYYINGEAYHPYFDTYEEAELECLKKLIEIVKSGTQEAKN